MALPFRSAPRRRTALLVLLLCGVAALSSPAPARAGDGPPAGPPGARSVPATAEPGVAPMAEVAAGRPACDAPAVRVAGGEVCGRILPADTAATQAPAPRAVRAYLGIPYAATTAGAHRFRPPSAPAPWSGVLRATSFGDACPQADRPTVGAPMSEACLWLNVWRPVAPADDLERDVPRPVLVYLHGGSFVNGSASEQLYPGGPHLYEGARIASTQDVLVVTLNYRLGALGFLAGAPGVPADLGLLDQVAALRWVHDHIGAFGGDPARVTLVGESAGAMAASLHLTAMPASAGLFRAAILQSDPFGLPFRTLPQARRSADLFLLATRCKATFDTAACLRRLPLEAILAAQGSPAMRRPLLRVGLPAFLAWGPVVDGVTVTRQPLAAAFDGAVDVPVLVGTNASEGTVFFAGGGPIGYQAYRALDRVLFGREAAQRIEARLPPRVRGDNVDAVIALTTRYLFDCATDAFARAGDAPVYRYRFEAVPSFNLWTEVPRCADESCHADELAFVFGTAGGLMPFTPRERRLSDAMMPAWGSFVRDPSAPRAGGAGAPAWPDLRSSGEALVIDGARLTVAPDAPGDAQAAAPTCDFWDALGYPVGAPPQRRVPPR